jgi:hypothetical protein
MKVHYNSLKLILNGAKGSGELQWLSAGTVEQIVSDTHLSHVSRSESHTHGHRGKLERQIHVRHWQRSR